MRALPLLLLLPLLLGLAAPAGAAQRVRPAERAVTGPGTITSLHVGACASPGRATRPGRARAVPGRRASVRVRLDGRLVARVAVTRRAARRTVVVRVPTGRHRLAFAVAGCPRGVRVGGLRWSRPPAAPVPAPTSAPVRVPPAAPVAAPAATPTAAPEPVVAAVPATPPVALGTALAWPKAAEDDAYRAALLERFASVTPENALKMEWLQPRPGLFDFADADAAVDFARDAGLAVRGHTLIWGNQLPWWMTRYGPGMDATQLEGVLREHVMTVMEHFAGRVRTWDVVNEALTDDGSWRHNVWLDGLGPGYVETAFAAARAADPDARLVYNEIAAETPGPRQDAMVALVARLRAAGLIDGVGLQLHTTTEGAPSRATLEATIRRFAGLGVDVEITEADVDARGAAPATRGAEQATAFADAAAACRSVAACTGFTVWGVGDGDSWQGPGADSLLLDAGYAPKPAWAAVARALGSAAAPAG